MVKRTLLVLLCSLVSLGMMASLACAADEGPYVSVQAGATWVNDADFDYDLPAPAALSGEAEFDTGYNVGVAAGYDFGTARLEAEVAYRENDFDQIEFTTSGGALLPLLPDGTYVADAEGELTTLSFMVNGFWDIENASPVTPYLGAGAGLANVDDDDDDDTVFAYQFAAGVGVELTPTIILDIGYRYFATDDPEFDDDGWDYESEYVTHNANLGFRFMF